MFLFAAPAADAVTGVPTIISYQGRLYDSSGNLETGTFYFKFSIWDNPDILLGTKLWPTNDPGIATSTLEDGVFTVNIGDTANGYPDPLTFDFYSEKNVYLQVAVSSNGTDFETLDPRQRISASGYALNAETVSGKLYASSSSDYTFVATNTASGVANLAVEGQVQIGGFSSAPTTLGGGALYYDTSNGNLFVWNAATTTPQWVSLGGGGGGGSVTLQQAYGLGNTILTTNARDISFTLDDTATDSNFVVNLAKATAGVFQVQASTTPIFTMSRTNATSTSALSWNFQGATTLATTSVSVFTIGGDTLTDLVGTGLALSGTTLTASLGTSVSNGELENDTINFDKIASALTLDEETTLSAGSALNLLIGNNVTLATTGSGAINATDLICTNCIGATEIADLTLGTDTAGNYVASTTAGFGITMSGTAGEGWSPTIAIATTTNFTWGGTHTFNATTTANIFNSSGVNLSGGTMSGVTISSSPISGSIGSFTAATSTGAFVAQGNVTLATTSVSALTRGADTITDFTGAGLQLSANALQLALLATGDGAGATSSNSGLEFAGASSDTLALIQGCGADQILKWNDTANVWYCTADAGGGGNSFETIDAPAGTDPVADSATDILQLLVTGTNFTVTGSSTADSITFDIDESVLAGAGLAASGNSLIVATTSNFTWTGSHTFSAPIVLATTSITGGLNNNSGGITNAGAISGITGLTGSGALTVQSGGTALLTLLSASSTLMLDATASASATGTIKIADLDLLALGSRTDNPTGAPNGSMYYNTSASKFRCLEGGVWKDCDTGGGSGGGETLQQTYATSSDPEIVLQASPGGLSIRDNLTPISGNLFEIQNNGGTVNYFAVSSSSVSIATTTISALTVSGNTTSTNLTLTGSGFTGGGNQCLRVTNTGIVQATGADCGSGGGGTLQQAYASSTNPEITLSASPGGITIRDAATPIAGNLFEIQNNAGTSTYFSVSTSSVTLATTSISGGASISSGATISTGNLTLTAGNLVLGAVTRISNVGAGSFGDLTATGTISLPTDSLTDAFVQNNLTIVGGSINNTPIGASTSSTAIFSSATTTGAFIAQGNVTLATTSITGGLNNNSGGITNAGAIAGASTITASSDINTTGGALQTNTVTRITNAGALTNIASLTGSGALSILSGGANALNLDTQSGAALSIGNTTSTSITIGRTGIITTINGTTTANILNSSGVNLTGGTISGVTISSSPISGSTGSFSAATSTGTLLVQGVTALATTSISGTNQFSAANVSITGGSLSGVTGSFTSATSSGAFVAQGSVTLATTTINGGLNIQTGDLSTGGTVRLTNAGVLQNISALSSTGALNIDSGAGLTFGTATSTSITIGRTGITTTLNGTTSIANLTTANAAISGGSITGVTINNSSIGATTPSTGVFTAATSTGAFVAQGSVTLATTTVNGGLNIQTGDLSIGGTVRISSAGQATLATTTISQKLLVNTTATTTGQVNIVGSTGAATGVAGIYQETTINPTVGGNYQFGNRHIVSVAPVGTSTNAIGEFVRMIDDTSQSNTVRALELQAWSGTNNAGVNTGLYSAGRTFGVQAISNGAAGAVAQPAAIFGELTASSTVSQVMRLYSSQISTSTQDFAQFYHEGSNFSGTGLKMQFAQSGGTFSGNYLQFLRGATTTFAVNATGTLMIGTSTPYGVSQLLVCAQGNCTLPTATNTVAVFGSVDGLTTGSSIVARGTITQGAADFGEWVVIEGKGDDYAAGDLLSASDSSVGVFKKSSSPYDAALTGIVSKSAGFIGGGDLSGRDDAVIIALAGRAPAKVSGENGAIAVGDLITASSKTGVGMKATRPGRMVGVALEAFNPASPEEEGSVMIFVNVHWAIPPVAEMLQGSESGISDMNMFAFDPALTIKVGTLLADKIVVADLTIGSADEPAGFTIFDRITKQPYCVVMENGELVSYAGKCGGNAFTARVATQPATVIQFLPPPTPSPSPQPSPTESPAPALTESPAPSESPAPGPAESPLPSESPIPTESPAPSASPIPSESPAPSPSPSEAPAPTPQTSPAAPPPAPEPALEPATEPPPSE